MVFVFFCVWECVRSSYSSTRKPSAKMPWTAFLVLTSHGWLLRTARREVNTFHRTIRTSYIWTTTKKINTTGIFFFNNLNQKNKTVPIEKTLTVHERHSQRRLRRFPAASQLTLLIKRRSLYQLKSQNPYASIGFWLFN